MRATTIIQGVVTCMGGASPLDGRISWAAEEPGRFESFNSFLVRGSSVAIVIDTGVAAHRQTLLRQIGEALGSDRRVEVMLTRRQEFDSESNLGAIMQEFDVRHVYLRDSVRREDNFDSVIGIGRDYPVEFHHIKNGDRLGLGGGVELEFFETPLRLLSTLWAYERSSHVLFTSDSFGHVTLVGENDARICTEDDDHTSFEQVRTRALRKLWWLPEGDTSSVYEQLRKIFEDRDVKVIAPSHGKAIIGRDLVSRHVDMMLAVVAGDKSLVRGKV